MLFLSLALAFVQVNFFASAAPTKGTWTTVEWPFEKCTYSNPLLMTDASVLIFQICGGKNGTLYTLSPDINGKYETGIWKGPFASLPNNWGPLYFASSVLADGRVVIAGGEYNYAGESFGSSKVGVYDPVKNKWTAIPPPPGFEGEPIADSQSVVLPDGSWLLAHAFSNKGARLDPFTLTWTDLKFTGKDTLGGINDEEGWTLLPDGTVLTIDCYVWADYDGMNRTEIYNPATDTWTSAGASPVFLADIGEIGGQVLRPDGTVFVGGATGNVAFYDTKTKTWRKGPSLPKSPLGFRCSMQDGAAAILPNGNIFVPCSGGEKNSAPGSPEFQDGPVFWFELEGDKWYLQTTSTFSTDQMVFSIHMLQLPTGQILQLSVFNDNGVEIFTPGPSSMIFQDAWRPVITSQLTSVSAGSKNNLIKGVLFNGMTQGAAYGDDYQSNSNYPLLRITNKATKHVFYCRTHDHSSMGIALTNTPVSTYFDVPANIELGPSTLEVVAAGIPSLPLSIEVTSLNPISTPSPTKVPTKVPTFVPTKKPTKKPSFLSTSVPSKVSTKAPTKKPILSTSVPSKVPSVSPTTNPTLSDFGSQVFYCKPVVQFDGTQYTNYPSIPQVISSSLTISMWITTRSISADLITLGRSVDNYENEFLFGIDADGYLSFLDYCNGYGFNGISSVKVNTGVLTHVAFVKSETSGTFYVNGIFAGTLIGAQSCQYEQTYLVFGADMRDSNMYFSGSMSGVAIFPSILTPTQISNIYNGAPVNPTGNPLLCAIE